MACKAREGELVALPAACCLSATSGPQASGANRPSRTALTAGAVGGAAGLRAPRWAHRLADQALHAAEVELGIGGTVMEGLRQVRASRWQVGCKHLPQAAPCPAAAQHAPSRALCPPSCVASHLPVLVEQRHQRAAQLWGGVCQQATRDPGVGRAQHLQRRGTASLQAGRCSGAGGGERQCSVAEATG